MRPEGVFLFSGRATEEMASLPFSLLRDMLSVRFEIKETDAPPVAREKLERGLVSLLGTDAAANAEDLALQAHFIGQLLGLDFSASPHLRGILHDAEQIRQRAFSYLTRLFRSAGRGVRSAGEAEPSQAALVVLEDIHWADDGSLALIAHLARTCEGVPLMILCLARPTLLDRKSVV